MGVAPRFVRLSEPSGVSAAEIGNTLSIWRDLFADGDDVASGGKKLVEGALAAAWTSVMA